MCTSRWRRPVVAASRLKSAPVRPSLPASKDPRNLTALVLHLLSGDVKVLRNLLDPESGRQPNTHEPLPRREAREHCSGYTDLSVVWIAASVPDHELIGSKWHAAVGVSRSPTLRLRKTSEVVGFR